MEKYSLILPNESYAEQISAYRSEFLEIGSSMDGCGPLRITDDPFVWLNITKQHLNRETVPEGRVQATQFLYVRESDNKICGMIQVRHYFNEYLEKYAGNIGYSVRPSERRQGIAKQMLKDCLPFCKSIGLDRVLLACLKENEGSRRVILANGGVYESTVLEPNSKVELERYWIEV